MGKASSRKLPALGAQSLAAPWTTDPAVAQSIVRSAAVIAEARSIMDAMGQATTNAKARRYFQRMALCLGDFELAMRPALAEVQSTLGAPVSFAGTTGRASDGSMVRVGGDGVVQHSAPDALLVDLGLKPAKTTPRKSPPLRASMKGVDLS